ncbi:hypothetical protein HKX48_007313 [Thoreauomyces humboldtii]|nr:hypothetical protein HKX48_007313 [Thoreauomyces humboldtii]
MRRAFPTSNLPEGTRFVKPEAREEEEEEDDYMSDALLMAVQESPATTYKEKRKEELRKQQARQTNMKPLRVREQESRDLGLATELSEDNIGFRMLEKMGFKKGLALGTTSTDGLQKPIEVVIRPGKHGLGHDEDLASVAAKKRKRNVEEEEKLERTIAESQADYRTLVSRRAVDKRVRSDLQRARKVCETLDIAKGLERNDFWFPERSTLLGHDDADEDGVCHHETTLEKLARAEAEEADGQTANNQDDQIDAFEKMEPSLQLVAVSSYLRGLHSYCIWCQCGYSAAEELAEVCPGDTEEDH